MNKIISLCRSALILGVGFGVSACMSAPYLGDGPQIKLEQEAVAILVESPDESEEISADDLARIRDLVVQYGKEGDGLFVISTPSTKKGETLLDAALRGLYKAVTDAGVPTEKIDARSHWAPDLSIVRMGYYKLKLGVPDCKHTLSSIDMSSTRQNTHSPSFGCVTASNIAAMIADPSHVSTPVELGAPEPTRIVDIVDKYRRGESTESAEIRKGSTSSK